MHKTIEGRMYGCLSTLVNQFLLGILYVCQNKATQYIIAHIEWCNLITSGTVTQFASQSSFKTTHQHTTEDMNTFEGLEDYGKNGRYDIGWHAKLSLMWYQLDRDLFSSRRGATPEFCHLTHLYGFNGESETTKKNIDHDLYKLCDQLTWTIHGPSIRTSTTITQWASKRLHGNSNWWWSMHQYGTKNVIPPCTTYDRSD
jgi:hypothetical protein